MGRGSQTPIGGRGPTSGEAQVGHAPPPLTLCPACALPNSTSEASRPSKCRPWGRLAPARATTVGKMSSTLQEDQDSVGPSCPQALSLAVLGSRAAQPSPAQTEPRQPPIQPAPSASCPAFKHHLDFLQEQHPGSAARCCLGSDLSSAIYLSSPQFSVL